MGTTESRGELIVAPFIAPLDRNVGEHVVVRLASASEPHRTITWVAGTILATGYLPGIYVGHVVRLEDGTQIVTAVGSITSVVATLPTLEDAAAYAARCIRDHA